MKSALKVNPGVQALRGQVETLFFSSPGFSAGYAPGCAAGSSAADATPPKPQSARDEVRTRTDPDYRNGWDRGHAACFAAEQGAPHVGSMIIFWDPN